MWCIYTNDTCTIWKKNWSKQTNYWPTFSNQISGCNQRSLMELRKSFSQLCTITKMLSNQPNMTDWPQEHFLTMFWTASFHMSSKLLPRNTWFLLSNLPQTYSKLMYRICTCQPPMNLCSSCTCLWSPTPTCSTCRNSYGCPSISTLLLTFLSCQMLGQQIYSQLATRNRLKLFPALICTPNFTWETLSFTKEGRWWKQVWKEHV